MKTPSLVSDPVLQWYKGKTILLTGATSGIGREMAKILSQLGARLILCGRNEGAMKSLKQEMGDNQGAVIDQYLADLSSVNVVMDLCQCIERHHQVDILINNAAFGYMGDLVNMPRETVVAMQNVNILAVTAFSREFLPQLMNRPGCGVMNVGSVASFIGTPGSALYGATKHFIKGFTDALHGEMEEAGVHVTGLYPGRTQTDFLKRATDGRNEKWDESMSAFDVALAGLKGLAQNKVRVVPGRKNQLVVFLAGLVPVKRILASVRRGNALYGKKS